MQPRASIIISVQASTSSHTTELCFTGAAGQAREVGAEIVLVGDTQELLETNAAKSAFVKVIAAHSTGGPGQQRNVGAAAASSPVLVFLDSACIPSAGWCNALLARLLQAPEVGIVSGLSLTPDGVIYSAGITLAYGMGPPLGVQYALWGQAPTSLELSAQRCRAVSADGMAIRSSVFASLGGFETGYANVGYDVDLCLRSIAAGHSCWFDPVAQLVTERRARYDLDKHAQDQALFATRWIGVLDAFDDDIRPRLKGSAPRALSAARPTTSVVSVMLPGAIETLGPWLEITRATLGPNDDWVIVNAGAGAAAAAYAQWMAAHTQHAKFVEADGATYEQALSLGLAAAQAEFLALVAPNAAPSWHWLERGAAHLLKPTHGSDIVAASLTALGTSAPAEHALDLNVMQRALMLTLAGMGAQSGVPETLCFLARKTTFLDRIARATDGDLLRDIGPFHSAFDVWSTQLATPGRPAHQLDSLVAVQTHAAANLAFERSSKTQPSAPAEAFSTFGCAPYAGLVSVVVPVLNQPELTRAFLDAVYENTNRPIEIILVDNGSGPQIRELALSYATRHGNLVYIRNEQNQGFGYACNQGLQTARGEAVVVINNDVLVPQGWLSRMLAVLQANPRVGMVGAVTNRCVGPQQISPAPYAHTKDYPRAAAARAITHRGNVRTVGRLVGLCLLIPRAVIAHVGGFDPAFGYGNFEDDDLGMRVRRAGYELAIADDVLIHHEGSATFNGAGFDARALAQQNWEIFCDKWQHDPTQTTFAAIEALATQRPFSAQHDHIPVSFSSQFSGHGPRLPFETDKAIKLLFTPDVSEHGWWGPLRTYLATFGPEDPVAMILRPEPATQPRVQHALAEASALLNEIATAKQLPVVLLEATRLPPLERASLYRAVDAWIQTPGPLSPFVAREASACGVPALAPTAEAMRSFVVAAPRKRS